MWCYHCSKVLCVVLTVLGMTELILLVMCTAVGWHAMLLSVGKWSLTPVMLVDWLCHELRHACTWQPGHATMAYHTPCPARETLAGTRP